MQNMQGFMSNMVYIQKVFIFVSNQFPLLALISLLTITIILVFREKRRRKLILLNPKENEQIDELLKNKTINEEEAEKLKKAANALPEVVEEYPLPDIHLRLTAALAKTYSLLKILLIISKFYLFSLIWLKIPSATMTQTFEIQNLWLGTTILFLLVLFSVIQFIASIHLTRGGGKSRKLIAFIWLFDLAFLPIVLSIINITLYSIVAITTCAYSIWVLLLRNNAESHVSFEAKTPNKIMKPIFVFIFLACLVSGIFFIKSDIKHTFTYTFNNTVSRAEIGSSSSNNCSTLNKVAIIASSPEQETAELATKVFNSLQKQFPKLKFKYLKFGESFPKNEIKFDQFVFINKTKIVKAQKADNSDIPEAIRKIHFIGLGQLPKVFNNMPKSISFNVVVGGKFSSYYVSYARRGSLRLNTGSDISGSILVTSDTSNCSMPTAIEKCGKEIVKHLAKEYKKARGLYTHLNIPDFLAPPLKKVSFKGMNFLKGAWRIGNFRSANDNNFSIYLFPLKENRKKQKEAILENLKKLGWNHKTKYQKVITFSKTKKEKSNQQIRIYFPSKPGVDSILLGKPNIKESFGRFVYVDVNKKGFSAEQAEKFKKFDFISYVHCVALHRLKRTEFIEIFDRVYKDNNSSFDTLRVLYNGTRKLGDKRDKLLIKMGDALFKQVQKPIFNRQLLSFATLISKENKYPLDKHPAFVNFKDRIVNIKLRHKAEFKKYVADKITVSGKKSPLIVQISDIGKQKNTYLCIISCRKLKNKNNEMRITTGMLPSPQDRGGQSSMSFSMDTPSDIINQFVIFSKGGMSTRSGELFHKEKFNSRVHPGDLGFLYSYKAKEDQFEFRAIFKEK